MTLVNRFVRSATWEGLATKDGSVTPSLTDKMVELAKGAVGLIITGYTFVSRGGQSSPGQMAVYDEIRLVGHGEILKGVRDRDSGVSEDLKYAAMSSTRS